MGKLLTFFNPAPFIRICKPSGLAPYTSSCPRHLSIGDLSWFLNRIQTVLVVFLMFHWKPWPRWLKWGRVYCGLWWGGGGKSLLWWGLGAAGSRPSPRSRILRAHMHVQAGSRESRPAAGFDTQSSPPAHTSSSQAAPKPPKTVTNWESRFQDPRL